MTELTGVRVRETFPDEVLQSADEVVLIDVTPEALIGRLQAGKVYPGALDRRGAQQLLQAREPRRASGELALRQVAEDVESKRLSVERVGRPGEDRLASAVPQAVGEHLMVLIEPKPREQRVLRRAWRSAQRLNAPLDVLDRSVAWTRSEAGGEASRSTPFGALPQLLGANLIVEEGDDVAETAARVARERGTTYILMGVPKLHRGLGRFSEGLPTKILRQLPGVDLRVVADRSGQPEGEDGP